MVLEALGRVRSGSVQGWLFGLLKRLRSTGELTDEERGKVRGTGDLAMGAHRLREQGSLDAAGRALRAGDLALLDEAQVAMPRRARAFSALARELHWKGRALTDEERAGVRDALARARGRPVGWREAPVPERLPVEPAPVETAAQRRKRVRGPVYR